MELIKKRIDELKYADYNPRKRLTAEDKEYQKIKASIEEFGYADPIIVNKDNTIIGGHQRWQVLKDLGWQEIEVIQLDLSKSKEKALNIALNKISGEWDYAMLGDLLLDLDSENFDLGLTGFEDYELENIMAPVSFIDDLLENDYATIGINKETFDVSFNFDIKYKDKILNYIKENSKKPLIDAIVEECSKDA